MSKISDKLNLYADNLLKGTPNMQVIINTGVGLRDLAKIFNDQNAKCPHCGSSMKMYWHNLTPILVKALVKFRTAINDKKENSVHLKKDMDNKPYQLSRHERSNWTKLRFHGLVAKVKEDGKLHKRGYWLLTSRGNSFLNGNYSVPESVQTYKNVVVNHSDKAVTVKDVIGSIPFVEDLGDIKFDIYGGNNE